MSSNLPVPWRQILAPARPLTAVVQHGGFVTSVHRGAAKPTWTQKPNFKLFCGVVGTNGAGVAPVKRANCIDPYKGTLNF